MTQTGEQLARSQETRARMLLAPAANPEGRHKSNTKQERGEKKSPVEKSQQAESEEKQDNFTEWLDKLDPDDFKYKM